MKSLFSRFRHNKETAASSRPSSSTSTHDDARPTTSHRSSSYNVERSQTPIAALHSQSSSGSSDSLRPHSIAGDVIYEDETIRARTVSGDAQGIKKVTFRSPIPTPTTSLVLDEIPMYDPEVDAPRIVSQSKAASPTKPSSSYAPPSSSRSTSRQSLPMVPKPIMTRKSSLPGSRPPSTSPSKAMMSPTPSEQSLAGMSTRSYLPPPNSWSEMAEDDLIANLGPRERTRQEVLWEIVSSEERYVQELIKLNETFARTLLPPSARSPSLDLFDSSNILSRTLSPAMSGQSPLSATPSFDHLPIAAQYSHQPSPASSNARMQAYHSLTNGRPGAPDRKASHSNLNGPRSHQSLPPPKRDVGSGSSANSRMSYHPSGKAKGHDSRAASGNSISSIKSGETPLPDALEKVLIVLAGGILEGHIKLAAALRKRYENQYPLVRSLADVFTAHSYILREYATYVMHLEKALEQVEHALAVYTSQPNKRASRRLDETDLGKLGKILLSLEELAAERGESGLQISLSKPFQRLLKYPLLFQNLLFNTDPSLKEYEATLAMVDDVEQIVRTIEDEKASNEEREKTRDVWARIDGLDKEKTLMAPKPNRLLVSETQMEMSESELKALKDASAKQKKSFRRLSDILKGGEAADLWIVRFSDVSLLCARTGMTNLPVSNVKASRSDSMPEMNGKSRFATTGRRTHSIRARNLYRFVRLHEWNLKQKTGSTEGLLLMDEISRARSGPAQSEARPSEETRAPSPTAASPPDTPRKPLKVPLKGDGGPSPARSTPRRTGTGDADTDTMVSDRLSVMSFAFKGSDQIKPVPKRTRPVGSPAATNASPATPRALPGSNAAAVYPQRRSTGGHVTGNAANAKFAHRLRAPEQEHNGGDATVRPVSRTRRSLPPAMANSTKPGRASPVLSPTDRNGTRPPWNASSTTNTPKTTKAPSLAPSTRESVRGVRAVDTSVTGSGRRLVPKAIAAAKAVDGAGAGVGAGSGAAGSAAPARTVRPSPSTDSGVAGMWNAYRDGGATGTPRKTPGRQMGGRI